MPELPEVETIRRTLAVALLGRRIVSAKIGRDDVHTGPPALKPGDRFTATTRHGKQLALVTQRGSTLCVHLGMSGRLRVYDPREAGGLPPHTHAVWALDDGSRLGFTDPRRFGGLWSFASLDALLEARWNALGPDALTLTPTQLHRTLRRSRRALKAVLLNQHAIAGLGNIYADELLHATGLSPRHPADSLGPADARRLVAAMRRLLRHAIDAGGSTLRDYVDGKGNQGGYQHRHRVYGRAGLPCRRCRLPLTSTRVAGRTTTSCAQCQPETPVAVSSRHGRMMKSLD